MEYPIKCFTMMFISKYERDFPRTIFNVSCPASLIYSKVYHCYGHKEMLREVPNFPYG